MYKEHKLGLKIIALDIIYKKLYYMEIPEYYKGFMEDDEIQYIQHEISKINEKILLRKNKLISKRDID